MLLIPLSDENPLRFVRYQWVTIGIIAINVVVYLLQFSGLLLAAGSSLSVVPAELMSRGTIYGSFREPSDGLAVPEALTLLSYMFLHADVLHLASNMMFLWVFGDNVEDAMGHLRYLAFYLLCGIVAGLAQAMMQPTSQLPLVGASGAVAGTLAAYLISAPSRLGVGACIPRPSFAHHSRLDPGRMGLDPIVHGTHQPRGSGGVVGAHRRAARRRGACADHAPIRRGAFRSRRCAGRCLPRCLVARASSRHLPSRPDASG